MGLPVPGLHRGGGWQVAAEVMTAARYDQYGTAREASRPGALAGPHGSGLPRSGHAQGECGVHVRRLGGVRAGPGRRVPDGDLDPHAADRGGGRLEMDDVEHAVLVADGQYLRQQGC